MGLFRVEALEHRRVEFMVEADDEQEARQAGEELAYDELDETSDVDVEVTVVEAVERVSGLRVWVGGTEGRWE